MTDNIHAKVLILGSGPAGLTAGIYAARANLNPLMVSGLQPGGQMTITTDVENYPGFAETIQGPWLMEEMQNQARKVGTTFVSDLIVSVDFSSRPFLCTGDTGTVYSGDTVIVSTGATARWLGLDSEEKFKGFGVSACATCDGFFYRGKKVCVVGGGNTAVEEAIYLTNHAEAVTLIHRRDELRAEMILQDRLMANPKITVIWDSVLQEVIGDDKPLGVTGARIANGKTSEQTVLEFDGVFIAIGHNPNTEIFAGILDMDDEGYLITQADVTATNIPGVFAAGDVQDKIFRQAVTAAGTGCMAAIEAEKFLAAATSADRRSAAE